MKNGWITTKDGIKKHYKNNKLHRDDGPAIINPISNLEIWYRNGRIHRDGDKPAYLIYLDRNQQTLYYQTWYKYGKQHRDTDEPASICSGSTYTNYTYFKNGKVHRETGPAVIMEHKTFKTQYFYFNDDKIDVFTNEQFQQWIKLRAFQ